EYLGDAARVRFERWQAGGDLKPQIVGRRQRVYLGFGYGEHVVDAAWRRADLEPAGLQPGSVEQLLDKLVELVGLLGNGDDEIALAVGVPLDVIRQQGAGEAFDRGQRRPQLVGDHG